eukprot:1671717-Rhodomonas_salina.1
MGLLHRTDDSQNKKPRVPKTAILDTRTRGAKQQNSRYAQGRWSGQIGSWDEHSCGELDENDLDILEGLPSDDEERHAITSSSLTKQDAADLEELSHHQ